MKLPEFILAGFQKCGTTAIYNILKKHSGVGVSCANPDTKDPTSDISYSYPKELNYFQKDSVYNLGVDWYKGHFNTDLPCVDVSPNYLLASPEKVDLTLSRIAASGFSGNFIVVIRNPIDRAFSALNHFRQELPQSLRWANWSRKDTFIENIKKGTGITVDYNIGINKLINQFSKDRLTILVSERLSSGEQSEYDKLYSALGVKPKPFRRIGRGKSHKRDYAYTLSDVQRAQVKELYADKVKQLYELLGYEIPEWEDFQ